MGLRLLIFGIFVAAAGPAASQARSEIYKCVGASGEARYTNGAREPAARPQSTQARPNGFPRESAADRANAKGKQRQILEQELASEETNLAKAKEDLAEQEAVRNGDERNYARVLERLQPFKDREVFLGFREVC